MSGPWKDLKVRYQDDLRLFGSPTLRLGLVALVLAYLFIPVWWETFPVTRLIEGWGLTMTTLNYVGIFAIGALGLNLLTGYTGQVSLGHSVFVGVGAYFAAYAGATWDLPFWLWLPGATLLGFAVGVLIGPFALRLRGNYLVVVTLGLVFVGDHVFRNWRSVTGGNAGVSVSKAPLEVGPIDFRDLTLFGHGFEKEQGFFWLIWGFVAITALLVKNIVRTRPGRALQAVRDRDIAAEIIGIDLFRYKTMAFAISSAIAAMAGGLYGTLQAYVSPIDFGLGIAIQYIAIIILGGLGTVHGSIIGALFVGALPRVIDGLAKDFDIPAVGGDKGGSGGILSVSSLNQIIFGLLIAGFLLLEPRGIAGIWARVKAYFKAWPFSY
ncbi:MAG: branched-chain amino acid ABC transporter permease [Actinobacteria bacterium]|nr:branched-chain amino acid ABC transporter permease [Actinomycetota bacterium]MBL6925532.1 branched-chain amino acid ABC transporter permease [Acidimicrobiia bacterium]